jgi:hypothetical protein
MAIRVSQPGELQPGDLFEDCNFWPCLCTETKGATVLGISLVNGRWVNCSIVHCGLRKLTLDEAIQWKNSGPPDFELELEHHWW